MPITCRFTPQALSQDDFHAIDKVVMKHAFDIQNEFGRLCDEQIYKNELAFRCDADGIAILREAAICAEHKDFRKLYFLDMLADNGGIYELKATAALNSNHDLQLINYLLLAGLNHGKLINFRPGSVEYRFVSTSLAPADRQVFSVDSHRWNPGDQESSFLQETLYDLLQDWGVFLSVDLYEQALIHFLGGTEQVVHPVEIYENGRALGRQNLSLLRPDTELHISAISSHLASYENHLRKMLFHTPLEKLQWLNFDKKTVQMITLQK